MKLNLIKLFSLVALITTILTIYVYYHIFISNSDELSFKYVSELIYQHMTLENDVESDLVLVRSDWYVKDSPLNCSIPLNMDPFDPIIRPYVYNINYNHTKCHDQVEPEQENLLQLTEGRQLTFMNDYDSIVRLLRLPKKRHSLQCAYRSFDLANDSDFDVNYGEVKMLEGFSLNLKVIESSIVSIKCLHNGEKAYSRVHSWPLNVFKLLNQKLSMSTIKSDKIKPSVLIMVLESTSRLNFERFMKQTSKSLNKLSNNFRLKGLNGIGDNTWTNMIPLLTGNHVNEGEWSSHVPEQGPFDDLDLIWKDFKESDYITGYVEDQASLALFHHHQRKGFTSPPTDWYPRAHWLQIDNEMGKDRLSACFNRQFKLNDWLTQIKQFINLVNASASSYFLWSFLISPLQANFNFAQLVDHKLADFIDSYSTKIEDTVFILMGDHGPRFGNQTLTEYGQYESRLPLFNIHLPKQLTNKYPHLGKYLNLNQNRLTTWLDVREVLKDIASGNYEEMNKSNENQKAYSIWRQEVPITRDCLQARVPLEYCSCAPSSSLLVSLSIVQDAANEFIDDLNYRLIDYAGYCRELKLKKILKAMIFNRHNGIESMELSLVVDPSNAILRGVMTRSMKSSNIIKSKWRLSSDVERLNEYETELSCIDDEIARKYCYCFDNLLKGTTS